MALATACPHCGTIFRVAQDQLKLRNGLVRCGACQQVFNGIEQLLPTEPTVAASAINPVAVSTPWPAAAPSHGIGDAAPLPNFASTSAPPAEPADRNEPASDAEYADDMPATSTATPAVPAPDESESESESESEAEPELEPELEPEPDWQQPVLAAAFPTSFATPSELDNQLEQLLLRREPHLAALSTSDAEIDDDVESDADDDTDAEPADDVDRALDDLQGLPFRSPRGTQWHPDRLDDADTATDAEVPGFIRQARSRQRRGWQRNVVLAASYLLLLALLAQGVYAFRHQIAAWLPATRPLLAAACLPLGCRVNLPMQIDQVTIESSELQALAPDTGTFALGAVLRNRSSTVEAWPHLELTLNDAGETPVLRRVFAPAEYLSLPQSVTTGFAGNSEAALRIHFRLTQQKAAGYRLYLFYP